MLKIKKKEEEEEEGRTEASSDIKIPLLTRS